MFIFASVTKFKTNVIMSEVKATDIILSEIPKEKQVKGSIYVFDDCVFTESDLVAIDICDFKASSKGTTATITMDGIRTDKMVTHMEEIDSRSLVLKVREYVNTFLIADKDKHLGVAGGPVEPTKMDNVDEELLKDAEPAVSVSPVDIKRKNGFVEGAVIVVNGNILDAEEIGYGLMVDIWQDDKTDVIYIRLTDGRIMEADRCTIATDVNKRILRMVEAEKGRMIESAIKFGEQVDRNLEQIIFG
jgi:hypothetical protein